MRSKGFTLVEMLLAMTFLSILLISITLLIMQVVKTYDRGTTLRAVEQSGVAIADELRRAINQAENIDFTGVGELDGKPLGGRLCTGARTYAWNYGNTIRNAGEAPYAGANTYDTGSDPRNLRFVVVSDAGGQLCQDTNAQIPRADARELLQVSDRDVVLHDFALIAGHADIQAITMIVGTNGGEEVIDDRNCTVAEGVSEFCAVNTFEFTVRPGGIGGGN